MFERRPFSKGIVLAFTLIFALCLPAYSRTAPKHKGSPTNTGNSGTATNTGVGPIPIAAGPGAVGYNAAVLADTPTVHFPMLEASGNFVDVSGNGNTGVNIATIAYGQPPLSAYLATNSASFNGGGYAYESAVQATFDLTVETWVNLTAADLAQSSHFIDNAWSDGASTQGYALYAQGTTFKFSYANGRTLNAGAVAGGFNGTVVAGTLYHLVAMYDNTLGKATIYVNGGLAGTSTLPSSTNVNTGDTAKTFFGALNTGLTGAISIAQNVKGTMSNAAVYNHLLTPTRILTHYDIGIGVAPPTPTPTLAPNFNAIVSGGGIYAAAPIQNAVCINNATYANILPLVPPGFGAASGQPMGEFASAGYTKAALDATWGQQTVRAGSIGGAFSGIVATLGAALTIPVSGAAFSITASTANPAGAAVALVTSAVTAVGPQTVTTSNVTNIVVGNTFGIGGANPETIYVTAVSGTGFSANFTQTHAANDPIGSIVAIGDSPGEQGNVYSKTAVDDIVVEGTLLSASTTTWNLTNARSYDSIAPFPPALTTVPATSTSYGTATKIYLATSLAHWNGYTTGFGNVNGGFVDHWLGFVGDGTNGSETVPQSIVTDGVDGQVLQLTANPADPTDQWPNRSPMLLQRGTLTGSYIANGNVGLNNSLTAAFTWNAVGSSEVVSVSAAANYRLDQIAQFGDFNSGHVAVGFVGAITGTTITVYDIQYLEGVAGGTALAAGTNLNLAAWKPFYTGNVDVNLNDFQYGYAVSDEKVPWANNNVQPAWWTVETQTGFIQMANGTGGISGYELRRNEVDIMERIFGYPASIINSGDLIWAGFTQFGTEGFYNPGAGQGGGFGVSNPATTYHNYGSLWQPGGATAYPGAYPTPNAASTPVPNLVTTTLATNGNSGQAIPCTSGITSGVSEILDSAGVTGNQGCGDPTQRSGDKELQVTMQMNGGGLTTTPATTTAAFVVPAAIYNTVVVPVSTLTGWVQQLGREYDFSDGTQTMKCMLESISGLNLTCGLMGGSTATLGSTIATAALVKSPDAAFVQTYPVTWQIKYVRAYKPISPSTPCNVTGNPLPAPTP